MSLNVLPEECIATVLSMSITSPEDACRLSTVSRMFKSAADCDHVWKRLLPDDYQSIVSKSSDPQLLESLSTKKKIYLSLCDNPIIIDDGKKSFALDKKSGKKCYMLSARDLVIAWWDAPQYWRWHSDHASRFAEVAQLRAVCWLDIRTHINTNVLSPATWYTAHVVFKLTAKSYGLYQPAGVTMGFAGGESSGGNVFWAADPHGKLGAESHGHYPKERGDGWMETELGEFFNEGDGGGLGIRVLNPSGDWKSGLILEGIEIRPKTLNR